MKNAIVERLRNRFACPDETGEEGASIPELIVVMSAGLVVSLVLTGLTMNQIDIQQRQTMEQDARDATSRVAAKVTEEVRTAIGTARADEWGTEMWLRQADGTCTMLSLDDGKLVRTNFTMSGLREDVLTTTVLESNLQAAEGVPVFTATMIGADVTIEAKNPRAVHSRNFVTLPDTTAPVTPDTECIYDPLS